MNNPFTKALQEVHLCREELELKLKEHQIACLRGDAVKASKVRDEALTAFYQVISAAETAAITVRKLGG